MKPLFAKRAPCPPSHSQTSSAPNMHFARTVLLPYFLALSSGAPAPAPLLTGLGSPLSLCFSPTSGPPLVAYIGARNGSVSVVQFGASLPVVRPLTSVPVFSSPTSWHGLTSVHAAGAPPLLFLYATLTLPADPLCVDDGAGAANATARPPLTVLGCPRSGALVRWPLSADGLSTSGPLQLLFGGACSQFGANGMDMVTSGADGSLYVSTGAGANDGRDGGADVGQLGPQPAPCTAPRSAWGGHFNALAPASSAGKVLLFAPPNSTTKGPLPAPTVFALGLHNPFRLTWARVPAARGAPAPLLPSLFALDSAVRGLPPLVPRAPLLPRA